MEIDREVKVRNAIQYCIENLDCKTATNRIVEFWKDELKLQEQQHNIANISFSLLERAAVLVGKPSTNISGILAREKWQKDYERLCNERYQRNRKPK